jgi:hypothetical protein
MSKIINTTRGLVRPTRQSDTGPDAPEMPVTEAGLAPVQGRQPRPLGPVQPRRDTDERVEGGSAQHETVQQEEASPPLPIPRGLATDMSIAQVARISAKSPTSSMAVAQLIGALEQHARSAKVSHHAALDVLARLKGLLDHVTERRSWPRIPRVRRRLQRKRRDT